MGSHVGAFGEVVRDVRAIRWSPRGPSSKFIAYFNLLDAFRVAGCPVCTLLEQEVRRALGALLYEQVNDPFTWDRLVGSHGFCNWHAWMLPGVNNSASGVALIYHHLLNETLERVSETLREIHSRSRCRSWPGGGRNSAATSARSAGGRSRITSRRSWSSWARRRLPRRFLAHPVCACPTLSRPCRSAETTRTCRSCWPTTRSAGGICRGSWRNSRGSSTTGMPMSLGDVKAASGLARSRRSSAGPAASVPSVDEKPPQDAATLGEVGDAKAEREAHSDTLVREARELSSDHGLELYSRVVPGREVAGISPAARDGKFDLLGVGIVGHSNLFGRVMGARPRT